MSKFQLVRFGGAGVERCEVDCAGPDVRTVGARGALGEAVARARDLLAGDPLNVVEIRQGGRVLCTVGAGWMSHRVGERRGRPAA